MDNTMSLIIGIVSGIITSGVIYLAVKVFEKIIVPWYQSLVYKGLEIDGEWHLTLEDPHFRQVHDTILNISQNAHRIKGSVTSVLVEPLTDSVDTLRNYSLQGSISNKFVLISMEHTDRKRIGIGTFLLEVVGDGQELKGQWTHYDVGSSTIDSHPCSLKRSGNKSK